MQLILTFSGKQGIELLPKIKQQRKKSIPSIMNTCIIS